MRALVTGASRGIGAALLAEGHARGHGVTGTSRAGGEGLLALDVTDGCLQTACASATGAIDLLVCNAGVYLDKGVGLDGLTGDMLQATFAANVTGVALTVKAQRRNLSRGGRIAIVSSAMGSSERAAGNAFAYRASKTAAANLGANLARALAADGIAVGIYHPGWVRTDMGGAGADISPEQSARGLWDRFEALGPATTGEFLNHDGTPIPF
ncbi:SDR family NAD(P)-dependent oxidoreductase [Jannaschia ovalis]|uniref:SDR family NAD(P)-dependent oxidoreductase n=1 Tax=Jannaschia ovalis TaxID=3038773 RepID=A0ABY8LER2_9RHOB|nr:SDR family NAD(P)-dependent oxidoreductase [Jannaschia sp. GRR-S6-38]WGH78888.1 SDR family NAD(P)-dependent oxidoreductase [Jannaschia sp. GRR-S6-38]